MTTNRHIALDFISCINSHDVLGMSRLLAENAEFVSAKGEAIGDHGLMRMTWSRYFEAFPEYFIEVEQVLESGRVVAIFGASVFSDPRNVERMVRRPSAWRATIDGGLVHGWQVFAHDDLSVSEDMHANL